MSDASTRLLVIGAHPDDPDVQAGGTAATFVDAGCTVKLISMTDGGAGHHEMSREELVPRRRAEAAAAGAVIGAEYVTLDCPDGELEPTRRWREVLIAEIRRFRPDLIMTHRPNDYHPDHRYTSVLVQDAVFLVTVPNVVSGTPALDECPTVVYMPDGFQKPNPFKADVAVAIDDAIERKVDMLHCHTSQMYEWLVRFRDDVPTDEAERRRWLAEWRTPRSRQLADEYRDLLVKYYGPEKGGAVEYAECFEACEYGKRLTEENLPRLFPFLPNA